MTRFEIPHRTGSTALTYVADGLRAAAEHAPPPKGAERVLLVADATTAALYGEAVAASYATHAQVDTFTLPPGESSKDVTVLDALWRFAAATGLHRGDAIVALGGGVVSDVAGFAAATYHRGIDWIALPTTLLGMIDAAIGGKTAIDLPEGKNLAGAFHPPLHVLADPLALQTLPEREFRTGLAEVVKHALIANGPLLEHLRAHRDPILARDPEALETLLPLAASVKVGIVIGDETERGARAFLNYGHTLGHAIETVEGYAGRSHGEAVAIGLRFAAELAVVLGFPDRRDVHDELLEAYGLIGPLDLPDDLALLEAMRRDKKFDAGIVFVMLTELGSPTRVKVGDELILAALDELRGRA